MRNLIKVAFLSSVITAAMVYVILEWRPLRSDLSRPPDVSLASPTPASAPLAAAGNLIARVPGTGEGWLSFFSHLDTVPHEGAIEENLGVLQKNMGCRSAATEHAAASRPAMIMLVRAVMLIAGRFRPLMRDSDDR